jgi:peptidoglycan/xylan/chitin deacetylase (PgdA/CDA1 family)
VYEIEQRLAGRPDPAIDSHFEYSSRAGWWRIMEVLGQHGAPATVSSSGQAVERLPLLAQDAVRRGHEISAHGWRWEGHADPPCTWTVGRLQSELSRTGMADGGSHRRQIPDERDCSGPGRVKWRPGGL